MKQNKLSVKIIKSRKRIVAATKSINKIKKELGAKKIDDYIKTELRETELYDEAPKN